MFGCKVNMDFEIFYQNTKTDEDDEPYLRPLMFFLDLKIVFYMRPF